MAQFEDEHGAVILCGERSLEGDDIGMGTQRAKSKGLALKGANGMLRHVVHVENLERHRPVGLDLASLKYGREAPGTDPHNVGEAGDRFGFLLPGPSPECHVS